MRVLCRFARVYLTSPEPQKQLWFTCLCKSLLLLQLPAFCSKWHVPTSGGKPHMAAAAPSFTLYNAHFNHLKKKASVAKISCSSYSSVIQRPALTPIVVFVVERRTMKYLPTKQYRIVLGCGLVYCDHENVSMNCPKIQLSLQRASAP